MCLDVNEPGREYKKLDSGEVQGLEWALHLFRRSLSDPAGRRDMI